MTTVTASPSSGSSGRCCNCVVQRAQGDGDKQAGLAERAHPAEEAQGNVRVKAQHQFRRTIKLQPASAIGASPGRSLRTGLPEGTNEQAAAGSGPYHARSTAQANASGPFGAVSADAPAFAPATVAAIIGETPPARRRKTTLPCSQGAASSASVKDTPLASAPSSAYLTPQRRREQAQIRSRSVSPASSPSTSAVTTSRSPSSSWHPNMKPSDDYLRLASAPLLTEKLAALSLSLDRSPPSTSADAGSGNALASSHSQNQRRLRSQGHTKPKLLILDLNGTLCARKKRTKLGATTARPRPFLSSFLRYIFESDEAGDRRFAVMIWSSAQRESVASLLVGMGLDSSSPLLHAAWDRSSLGLTPDEFHQKVAVTKDLDKVWSSLAWPSHDREHGSSHWSQRDTLLIDDTADKAVLQPFNHLVLRPWEYGSADASDDELLRLVGVLEALSGTDNVSAALRNQGYQEDDRRESLVQAGRAALEKAGIPVTPSFDSRWKNGLELVVINEHRNTHSAAADSASTSCDRSGRLRSSTDSSGHSSFARPSTAHTSVGRTSGSSCSQSAKKDGPADRVKAEPSPPLERPLY